MKKRRTAWTHPYHDYEGVIILRTFSKAQGTAECYAWATQFAQITQHLRVAATPFAVTLAGGIIASIRA